MKAMSDYECTSCGADASESAKFCPECGEKFDGVEKSRAPKKQNGFSSIKNSAVGLAVGLFAVIVLAAVISSDTTSNNEQPPAQEAATQEANDDAQYNTEEYAEPEEPVTEPTEPATPQLTLDEMYGAVQLKMTEQQVIDKIGSPDMTGETDMQKLGVVKNLVYSSGMDNLTVSVQNGAVRVVVLGKFDSQGKISTKSKM